MTNYEAHGCYVYEKDASVAIASDEVTATRIADALNGSEALVKLIKANIGTMTAQVGRMDRWYKSHEELDTAIEQSHAALAAHKGERI